MNKRIEELARQAELPITCEYSIPDEFVERFAALIAKECASIADQESRSQRNPHGKQAADQIWHTITNRFGV